MTQPPPDHPYAAHPDPEEKPQRSRGTAVAIVISVLALIGVVVIIYLLLTGDEDATEPSASPTPSATPSETASETPSPTPSETESAGGSGIPSDPYLLGQEFTYDGPAIPNGVIERTGVWEVVIDDWTEVATVDPNFPDQQCYVVSGSMTPVSWDLGTNGPASEETPDISVIMDSGDWATADDDGLCDLTGFEDLTDLAVFATSGDEWPADETMDFALTLTAHNPNQLPLWPEAIVLGEDEYNRYQGIWVNPNQRLE